VPESSASRRCRGEVLLPTQLTNTRRQRIGWLNDPLAKSSRLAAWAICPSNRRARFHLNPLAWKSPRSSGVSVSSDLVPTSALDAVGFAASCFVTAAFS
jgi:hypothetical protein